MAILTDRFINSITSKITSLKGKQEPPRNAEREKFGNGYKKYSPGFRLFEGTALWSSGTAENIENSGWRSLSTFMILATLPHR